MELYSHQKRIIEENPRKRLLAHSMGLGKTITAIKWAEQNNYNTLVVCPKGLVEQWQQQVDIKRFHVVSKEHFKNSVVPKFDALIVDEADHFFSAHFKSQLSKSLRAYIKKHDPALLLLTGTPYRSSAWNIYTAAQLLGIRYDYQKFKDAFFYSMQMGHRIIMQPKKDLATATRLKRLIHSIADVVTLEECVDIPAQVEETIITGLSLEQKEAIYDNQEVVPIARFTADHKTEAEVGLIRPSFKLERITRILEENDTVIVVCRYLEQMDAIQKALGFQALRIDGSTKERDSLIKTFNKAHNTALIVQSALCEGWEAPNCSTMVFASLGFSYRDYVQMKARILRINALHKNLYVHLVAGDADKAILKAMKSSRDFDVLQDYERKR